MEDHLEHYLLDSRICNIISNIIVLLKIEDFCAIFFFIFPRFLPSFLFANIPPFHILDGNF